ncbi:MAG: chloride channel protein [Ruminococcaceae bacterium]|nr:chloride channel protein [Oscillospiraceae bacterium]
MKETVKKRWTNPARYGVTLLKWVLIGALIGGIGGVVGALFHIGVDHAAELRVEHPWVLYLLPVVGIAIAGLYRLTKTEGKGTNDIIDSVHFGAEIPWLLVPVIFLSTILTHLGGGSAGREGAALQIGGGIGYRTGRLLRLGEKELPLATLCGMSGVFAALFGTPMAATIFALEVVSVGVMHYAGLVPCLVSALSAYLIAGLMSVPPTRFTVVMPGLEISLLLRAAILAILCSLVSILFCRIIHGVEHLLAHWFKNSFLRVALGGAVLVVLTLLLGTDYNGAGMEVIDRAVAGEAFGWAWLLKILFTALTIGSGFKGGEVVPSFFVGATFGCVAGSLLGLPAGMGAAIGMICVFCGAVNCPIASVFLSIELFGAEGILYFALGCAISYLLSGYCGLYSSQTIVYSKMRTEMVNINPR